jgi:hypothetical protein
MSSDLSEEQRRKLAVIMSLMAQGETGRRYLQVITAACCIGRQQKAGGSGQG